MKRLFFNAFLFCVVILLIPRLAHAQQKPFSTTDRAVSEKYANYDFKGKFVISPEEDATNHYYIVDFSSFSTKFEKVYFMNLTFSGNKIVNIDSDISKKCVWFLVNKNSSVQEVINLFEEIRKNTETTAKSWSEEQKLSWLKENDKYK